MKLNLYLKNLKRNPSPHPVPATTGPKPPARWPAPNPYTPTYLTSQPPNPTYYSPPTTLYTLPTNPQLILLNSVYLTYKLISDSTTNTYSVNILDT